MDFHDTDHEEPQEIDLQSLKRALMRRAEAVERFRAAKAQLLRASPPEDARSQDQPPQQG
jgi:hypothetical protein